MVYMTKGRIIIVSTLTTREVYINIYENGKVKHYDVEIDIDVPYDEIQLNAYEQFNEEKNNENI